MKLNIQFFKIILVVFLINSCKPNNEDYSKKSSELSEPNYNPIEELKTIQSIIKSKKIDSVSDKNYTCFIKDNQVIKLNIYDGDGENFSTNEEYFFKNNNVIAYKRKEINFPNSLDYEALIVYKNSEVVDENFWLRDKKCNKTELDAELNIQGLSIQNDIIQDKEANKSKGLLTLIELSKRYDFNIKNISKSNKKSFSEIRGLIIAGSKDNMKKVLGKPNDDVSAYDFFQKYRNFKVEGTYGIQSILNTEVIIYNDIELTNKPIAIIYCDGVTSVKYLSEINNIEDLRP